MLESLVLKKLTECTSQHVKRTSGPRFLTRDSFYANVNVNLKIQRQQGQRHQGQRQGQRQQGQRQGQRHLLYS